MTKINREQLRQMINEVMGDETTDPGTGYDGPSITLANPAVLLSGVDVNKIDAHEKMVNAFFQKHRDSQFNRADLATWFYEWSLEEGDANLERQMEFITDLYLIVGSAKELHEDYVKARTAGPN